MWKIEGGNVTPYETWVEIDLAGLRHNLANIRRRIPAETGIIAVLKGNAYGHGAVLTAKALLQQGVNRFAVATINEAVDLFNAGIDNAKIHILGSLHPDCAKRAINKNFINTICTKESAQALAGYAKHSVVHINIDLGMNRVGCEPASVDDFINYVEKLGLKVEGLFGHLPDVLTDKADTERHIQIFRQTTDKYQGRFIRHLSNSPGLYRDTGDRCQISFDYIRVGSALYGNILPGWHTQADQLKRLLTWKAKPSLVQRIYKGEGVGYGSTYIARQNGWLATLPVGYADGIPFALSGIKQAGQVKIGAEYFPIVGKICMDHLMIEIPDKIPLTTECLLMTPDADPYLSTESIADMAQTTTTDVISGIHPRVMRLPLEAVE